MKEYRGIIVDASLENTTILQKLTILSSRKDQDWTLYKVNVAKTDIKTILPELAANLKTSFYAHFYSGNELIVVFRNKWFETTPDRADWAKVIEYGLNQGIPREQLDFSPCHVEDETF